MTTATLMEEKLRPLTGVLSRWYINLYLNNEGKSYLLPSNLLSDDSDTFRMVSNWSDLWEGGYSPFTPAAASYFFHQRGWDEGEAFEEWETLANDTLDQLRSYAEQLEEGGEEEWEDDDEALAATKYFVANFPDQNDLGHHWGYEIKDGFLYVNIYLGDGSNPDIDKRNTNPEHACFTADDLSDIDQFADLEALDRGECPDRFQADELPQPLLVYALGNALVEEVGESEVLDADPSDNYNYTSGLIAYLQTNQEEWKDTLADFEWGGVEGEEVVALWLEAATN